MLRYSDPLSGDSLRHDRRDRGVGSGGCSAVEPRDRVALKSMATPWLVSSTHFGSSFICSAVEPEDRVPVQLTVLLHR